ncbi:MAG: ribonucrease, partial [Actinomycetota bacterium]|nr:ribonucrease [Actinomycetota bacterium]
MGIVIGLVVGLFAGSGIGYFVRQYMAQKEVTSAESRAKTILQEAERTAGTAKKEALVEAKDEIFKMRNEAEADLKRRREEIDKKEDRISQREATLDSRAVSLDRREQTIESKENEITAARTEIDQIGQRARVELERAAGMTAQDAKQALVEQIQDEAKRDAMTVVRDIEAQAREEGDKRGRKIIAIAMQRVASDLTTESTVTTITLPNEDMKGRIIG